MDSDFAFEPPRAEHDDVRDWILELEESADFSAVQGALEAITKGAECPVNPADRLLLHASATEHAP